MTCPVCLISIPTTLYLAIGVPAPGLHAASIDSTGPSTLSQSVKIEGRIPRYRELRKCEGSEAVVSPGPDPRVISPWGKNQRDMHSSVIHKSEWPSRPFSCPRLTTLATNAREGGGIHGLGTATQGGERSFREVRARSWGPLAGFTDCNNGKPDKTIVKNK